MAFLAITEPPFRWLADLGSPAITAEPDEPDELKAGR
jgi:hypothetical protein